MFDRWSTWQLVTAASGLYLVFWGIVSVMPDGPQNPRAGFAAAATPDINTRTAAGTGAAAVPYSYCAHWFARDGKACISTGKSGDLVVVDTGIPKGSSGDIAAAATNCQRTGCKVALYCECENAAHVQQVKDIFSSYAVRFPGIMFPAVEVDGIRDIPGSNVAVAQALGTHGLSLILKNSNAIERFSPYTPVARVIYEDIGRTGSYLGEFKALAQSRPSLLLSGILHQGSYASDLGGSAYPGTSAAEAQQIFAELAQYKNVELFYGTSNGFQKMKSFDSAMVGIAREEGAITSRYAPPGMPGITNPINPSTLAQNMQGLSNPPVSQTQPPLPYSPSNVQLAGFNPIIASTSPESTNPNIQKGTSTAMQIAVIAGYTPTQSTSSNGTTITFNGNIGAIKNISASTSDTQSQNATGTNTLGTASTFTSDPMRPKDDLVSKSILQKILASVAALLQSVLAFFSGGQK